MDRDHLKYARRFLLFLAVCVAVLSLVFAAVNRPQSHHRASSLSYAKQLSLGLMMASQDNKGRFPDLRDPQKTLLPYVKNKALFFSPRSHQPFVFNATLSGKPLARIARQEQRITFYEAVPDSEPVRVVAFANGSVRSVERTPGARQPKAPLSATERLLLRSALTVLLLCAGAAGTVAAERTGWERARVFVGYSLLYAGAILLVLAFLFPVLAQAREAARMV